MGICKSINLEKNPKENLIDSKNYKQIISPEAIIKNSTIYMLDPSIARVSKAICKIESQNKIASGFLIKLFKEEKEFFCLMTNEHIITKEMVSKNSNFNFYYDSSDFQIKVINLNPKERYIKYFTDINIDVTVIEILPNKDNIPKNYFLQPNLNYMCNFYELIGQQIAIMQYPKGNLGYSFGIITDIITPEYEFSHSASTEQGSSGSPIFLKNSDKVIGIHKGTNLTNSKNYGHFIGPIFYYFKNFSSGKNIPQHNNSLINNFRQNNNNLNLDEVIKNNKNESIKKIKQEFDDLTNLNEKLLINLGFFIRLDLNNIFHWRVTILGPIDSLYAGGLFDIKIFFPNNYPNSPPEIFFVTPIYHINVCSEYSNRYLGKPILRTISCWKPSFNIKKVLIDLYSIFYWQNIGIVGPSRSEILIEYHENKSLFESKIKYFTKKYANPKNCKIYKKWDFSCSEDDLKSVKSINKKKIEYNNYNRNVFINLKFSVYKTSNVVSRVDDTFEIYIKCKSNEITNNVIQKILEKINYNNKSIFLFIFQCKRLDFRISIGDNGLKNESEILIIWKENNYADEFSLIV